MGQAGRGPALRAACGEGDALAEAQARRGAGCIRQGPGSVSAVRGQRRRPERRQTTADAVTRRTAAVACHGAARGPLATGRLCRPTQIPRRHAGRRRPGGPRR